MSSAVRAVLSPRWWARTALIAATEPPFVPPRLWPSAVAREVVDRYVPAVLGDVLDHIDITQVIIDHVSVARIVESIDLNSLVSHLDVGAVAAEVVEQVDLPGLIRGSTGTLASDSVVGVRLQSASADDRVDRVVAHLIPGRRRIAGHVGD